MESKNNSMNFLKVCFCSGGFAAPNRRLLDRKLIFDFVRPFAFVPKYTGKCERSRAKSAASEQTNCPQNSQCLDWSQLLNEMRTHFEQEFLP
ncbi:MAG TPA: hypothetical protein PKK37_01940 [Candidatus Pacearchaeota archaeon]|nr:hypothetical protein [Candidatus Pacearchaeota archaeon]